MSKPLHGEPPAGELGPAMATTQTVGHPRRVEMNVSIVRRPLFQPLSYFVKAICSILFPGGGGVSMWVWERLGIVCGPAMVGEVEMHEYVSGSRAVKSVTVTLYETLDPQSLISGEGFQLGAGMDFFSPRKLASYLTKLCVCGRLCGRVGLCGGSVLLSQ